MSIIPTSNESDTDAPPPTPGKFPMVIPNVGTLRVVQHDWASGSNWGLGVGDYNRGEVVGETLIAETHTSERNDLEAIEAQGYRLFQLEFEPLPSFTAKIKVKVSQTIVAVLRTTAMNNVENDPAGAAAVAQAKVVAINGAEVEVKTETISVQGTVKVTRSASSTSNLSGSIETTPNQLQMPKLDVDASQTTDDTNIITTTRDPARPPVQVTTTIVTADAEAILGGTKLTSPLWKTTATLTASSQLGDVNGFADAVIQVQGLWTFEVTRAETP